MQEGDGVHRVVHHGIMHVCSGTSHVHAILLNHGPYNIIAPLPYQTQGGKCIDGEVHACKTLCGLSNK